MPPRTLPAGAHADARPGSCRYLSLIKNPACPHILSGGSQREYTL